MRYMKHWLLIVTLFSFSIKGITQETPSAVDKILSFPDKVFSRIDKKAASVEQKLTTHTETYLNKLEKQELKLKRKLWKKDSVKAKEVFGDVQGRYQQLRASVQQKEATAQSVASSVYNGHLDSLGTALNFLHNNPLLKEGTKLHQQVQSNLKGMSTLKQSLNAGEQVRKQIKERQEQLKTQLQNTAVAKEFQKYKKQVYYYQQQLKEYQQLVKDPEKLGARLLTEAKKLPAFEKFFKQHSELASLFRMPGADATGNPIANFAGLQTRSQVMQLIEQRLGAGGSNAQQVLQQNIGMANNYLSQLKNKVAQAGGNSSSDELPDFKPNDQKTKSFLKRLEFGSNIQTKRARSYFPTTSDIGLSVGYKLNSKSIVGIGGSYKLGWGSGFNNISITHQGIGFRSFIDWKLKGSFWISGGYEQNYLSVFRRIDELSNRAVWKQSALIGMSKVIDVKSKFFKKTKVQLLYDALWKVQVPQTEAVLFRVGYNF